MTEYKAANDPAEVKLIVIKTNQVITALLSMERCCRQTVSSTTCCSTSSGSILEHTFFHKDINRCHFPLHKQFQFTVKETRNQNGTEMKILRWLFTTYSFTRTKSLSIFILSNWAKDFWYRFYYFKLYGNKSPAFI